RVALQDVDQQDKDMTAQSDYSKILHLLHPGSHIYRVQTVLQRKTTHLKIYGYHNFSKRTWYWVEKRWKHVNLGKKLEDFWSDADENVNLQTTPSDYLQSECLMLAHQPIDT
ncbi:hypothetical protein STEG23_018345, partial [Scotinomys teguina]